MLHKKISVLKISERFHKNKTNGEMEKCKIKAIQADLGIFTPILTYSRLSRHNQTYSGIFKKPVYILRTMVYSESRHIQNH